MVADIQALIAALQNTAAEVRIEAAEKLAHLEADAQGAAVPLVEAFAAEDEHLRDWVVAALEGLGPPDTGDIERLAALLKQPSIDTAYWAATLLGRLHEQAAAAVPALADALTNHPETSVRERAAWALAQIGPAASAARDALQQAAAGTDRRLARLAQEAIGRL